MNKKEIRKQRLERHYATLERLSEFLGKKQDGKKLSLKLWALEKRGNRIATDYCNGENGAGESKWEFEKEQLIKEVNKVFQIPAGVTLPGLIINGDARGHTLKIDDEKVRSYYPESIGFHRDWGGYGILSPEIE
jgi:hypothetical protein